MKPILIQHLIRQLRKTQPKKIVDEEPQSHGKAATIFVLCLVAIILVVSLK